jgi:hypothetical protein
MASLTGRHTHPAVRLGFKLSRGRQTLPGRFDSCCLPPDLGWRLGTGDWGLEVEVLRADPAISFLPPAPGLQPPALSRVAIRSNGKRS